MSRPSILFALFLVLGIAVVRPCAATACPSCQDAVAAGTEADDEPFRESKAYNASTLFMVAVPYTLFAVGGFALYRIYRKGQRDVQLTQSRLDPGSSAA
ncbi:MAG: hypothetical protein K2R98_16195 [Gemmataceae bacterium]|nr:hypothetical protein [Gemmataceae bacterium]